MAHLALHACALEESCKRTHITNRQTKQIKHGNHLGGEHDARRGGRVGVDGSSIAEFSFGAPTSQTMFRSPAQQNKEAWGQLSNEKETSPPPTIHAHFFATPQTKRQPCHPTLVATPPNSPPTHPLRPPQRRLTSCCHFY